MYTNSFCIFAFGLRHTFGRFEWPLHTAHGMHLPILRPLFHVHLPVFHLCCAPPTHRRRKSYENYLIATNDKEISDART